jgi:hypothetical protein
MRIGLWGYPQGDISASYSADYFSLSKTVRNPFTHDHGQFVIMDGTGGHFCVPELRAYPISHESYLDDVKAEVERIGLDDSYVARPLKFRRQCCILGIPKIFRQRRDCRVSEVCDLARRMFAYGGLFAAEAGTYGQFLKNCLSDSLDEEILKTLLIEWGFNGHEQTQDELRQWIEGEKSIPPATTFEQPSLFG